MLRKASGDDSPKPRLEALGGAKEMKTPVIHQDPHWKCVFLFGLQCPAKVLKVGLQLAA